MQRARSWCVVDASVWVSRFVAADVNHAASAHWLYQYLKAGNVVVAPALLLVEVAGAVARRTASVFNTEQIVQGLRVLPGMRWVSVGPSLRDHAADLAVSMRLRGADAVYVAVADRLRIPLITWDGEQLTRTGSHVTTRTP